MSDLPPGDLPDMAPNDPAPSYEDSMKENPRIAAVESAASNPEGPAGLVLRPFSTQSTILAGKVGQIQQARVEALIEEHFMPFAHEHAGSGIAKATFVLLLTDTNDSARRSTKRVWYEDGRTDVGFCQYAWIGDDENQRIFWRQPQVLKLLERTLRARLGLTQPTSPVSSENAKSENVKKSWWLRRILSGRPGAEGRMFAQGGSGWQTPSTAIPASSVSATLEDMRFRDASLNDGTERKRCQAVVITTYLGS